MFTIAYGADADLGVLTQISEATSAAAYDSRKPGKYRPGVHRGDIQLLMTRFVEELKDAVGPAARRDRRRRRVGRQRAPGRRRVRRGRRLAGQSGDRPLQGRDGGRTRAGHHPAEPGGLTGSRRAGSAAHGLGELSSSMERGPLAERIALMRPQVDDSTATLERLAGRPRSPAPRSPGSTSTGSGRSTHGWSGPEERQGGAGPATSTAPSPRWPPSGPWSTGSPGPASRCSPAWRPSTISIEELLARVVELSAMSATGALEPTRALDELADALEGVRQGLHETEQITRDALDR